MKVSVEPHLFIIFGATGDLMHRKLLPALYRLVTGGHLTKKCVILGVARTDQDDAAFRQQAQQTLLDAGFLTEETASKWMQENLHYLPMMTSSPAEFAALAAKIEAVERQHELSGNRIFYLALPPSAFPTTIEALGSVGLNKSAGWTRLVIEKPFGRDLASARELNTLVHHHFEESQVYRIDHYLGKETVQNLLFFRFANVMFESLWNRDRIRSVQITVAEDLGVEHRAGYYETAGAFRDMIQNHVTQLLTLVAMEPPVGFNADDIREEKVQVLRSIAPIKPGDFVFGQYAAGKVGTEAVIGYRDEEKVNPESLTETFVGLRLEVANWRWQGVPFYIRTGKRLQRRVSQIVVNFRKPPVSLFRPFEGEDSSIHSNKLVISIQPDEGFDLHFEVKAPGETKVETQRLRHRYSDTFTDIPDGYQTLLFDVILGDQTLFVRADEVEASWKLYRPLLENPPAPHPYWAGSWGPTEAEKLIVHADDHWRVL
ncbi:MAG: glucose-6-phosphate 1-dehydrogenase [Chlorobi bacterium OLB7]|nr:MAG: glucose-6-phosphate 1-dehydrogenase [Chlorobi bacterium OLB7]